MIELLLKEYDGESVVDIFRDLQEALEIRPEHVIPTDEHGFAKGTFKVELLWTP